MLDDSLGLGPRHPSPTEFRLTGVLEIPGDMMRVYSLCHSSTPGGAGGSRYDEGGVERSAILDTAPATWRLHNRRVLEHSRSPIFKRNVDRGIRIEAGI